MWKGEEHVFSLKAWKQRIKEVERYEKAVRRCREGLCTTNSEIVLERLKFKKKRADL